MRMTAAQFLEPGDLITGIGQVVTVTTNPDPRLLTVTVTNRSGREQLEIRRDTILLLD